MTRTAAVVAIATALVLTACAESADEAATEPATTEPAASELAATEPASTEPAATEPAPTEPAATDETTAATITATNFAFDTTAIEVADGDTIEFTVAEGSHSFTSSEAGFDTGVFAGETRTVTVDAAPGTYSYRCTLHGQMQGEVTVTG